MRDALEDHRRRRGRRARVLATCPGDCISNIVPKTRDDRPTDETTDETTEETTDETTTAGVSRVARRRPRASRGGVRLECYIRTRGVIRRRATDRPTDRISLARGDARRRESTRGDE